MAATTRGRLLPLMPLPQSARGHRGGGCPPSVWAWGGCIAHGATTGGKGEDGEWTRSMASDPFAGAGVDEPRILEARQDHNLGILRDRWASGVRGFSAGRLLEPTLAIHRHRFALCCPPAACLSSPLSPFPLPHFTRSLPLCPPLPLLLRPPFSTPPRPHWSTSMFLRSRRTSLPRVSAIDQVPINHSSRERKKISLVLPHGVFGGINRRK